MSITVVSNTESQEAASATIGDLARDSVVEKKSAPSKESEKPTEESEPSESAIDSEAEEAASEGDENEADSEEESEGKDEKPKRKSGFKRRIDKLNTRISEKDRELEYWKAEALKGNKPKQDVENEKSAPKKETEGRPKPDDFESHDDYIDALTDWKIEARDRDRETKQKETQIRTEYQKQVDSHVERVKAFAKEHKDFSDLMDDVDHIPMSVTVQEVILGSENGPELMYELAKNPEEYERICRLPAIAAARELGKFEAGIKRDLESKTETREVKTTKAPKPLSPVGSKSGSATTKSIHDPNLSQREYEELRAKQAKRA